MEGCRLIEYRPGRYAWADEAGTVIRKATGAEADAELGRLFAGENAGGDLEDLDEAELATVAQALDAAGDACAPPGRPSSAAPDSEPAPVATDSAAAFWLWVDPRREPGYSPASFDQAAFLARAVAIFQTKARWGGRPPAVVLANPAQAENGLPPAAEALGLAVVSDPTVTAGTYRLGLATERGGGADGRV